MEHNTTRLEKYEGVVFILTRKNQTRTRILAARTPSLPWICHRKLTLMDHLGQSDLHTLRQIFHPRQNGRVALQKIPQFYRR